MTTIADSTGTALGLISFLLFAALYVWTALALSAVFRKSGEQVWKAWVPVLNMIVLLELGRLSGWLLLLVLIPFAGPLIVWALLIVACYRINLAFGHGAGMTVLAALLLPVWATILGFGPARWLGTELGARAAHGGGPRRSSAPDDIESEFVPRATPPAYTPSTPLPGPPAPPPSAPVGGWTPPPMPPVPPIPPTSASEPQEAPGTGRWGGFDLGAVSEVTSEVTGADSSAPAPISAVPVHPVVDDAPLNRVVDDAPLRRVVDQPPVVPAPPVVPRPVSRVPAVPAPEPEAEPWAPARSPRSESDAFPETSGHVSAIASAPDAGTPRSARASVSAQHTKAEIPDDPIDETIVTRRRRTAWSLIPPAGAAVPITADVVLLGRKPAPDRAFPDAQLVSIDDGTVSKTHARLALRDEQWFVTDLGSTNGVLFATLMGTEVEATPGVEIEAGERFFLGDAEVRLQRSVG